MTRTGAGERFALRSGDAFAEVGTVAAVLTALRIGGVDLTEPLDDDTAPPPFCSGIALAPWPNRVRQARWVLDGEVQQLDITEPSRGGALHGLLEFAEYEVRERTDAAITLGATIHPQHGWPFLLHTTVQYSLSDDGLTVTHTADNIGSVAAPWAVGAHPYLRVGAGPLDEVTLEIRARRRLVLDELLLPVGVHDVAPGDDFDLSTPRMLGPIDLNVAYADVATGPEGAAVLTAPDGARTVVWQDAAFRWLQVFTPRDFRHVEADGTETAALAVALEPMTAPPDALNSGEGLAWLQPGERWVGSWGIRYEEKA